MLDRDDLVVRTLGECTYDSPIRRYVEGRRTNEHFVAEDDRVLVVDTVNLLGDPPRSWEHFPSFEPGGPRTRTYFPGGARVGVVTCGGLCPGLNDVISGLVTELTTHYDVREITGFAFGFQGLVPDIGHATIPLDPARVAGINEQGGTVLGTSRGAQDPIVMVDRIVELGLDILFVIGGDGSMKGASSIAAELRRRDLPIAVVGIPKTIDNDIPLIGQSFGFNTAYTVAARSVRAARVEAQASPSGVGLVKLMGRHSGFIACYAALASHAADLVLIPEVEYSLPDVVTAVRERVKERGSAVVVVAEGFGQDLLSDPSGAVAADASVDASGNAALKDIGLFLKQVITEDFARAGEPLNLKYIDPSYAIRSVPANAHDSVYCVRLAQVAVHAAMAGRTDMMVGRLHNRYIHVPLDAMSGRNEVAADGDLWLAVLESTAQPWNFERRAV